MSVISRYIVNAKKPNISAYLITSKYDVGIGIDTPTYKIIMFK